LDSGPVAIIAINVYLTVPADLLQLSRNRDVTVGTIEIAFLDEEKEIPRPRRLIGGRIVTLRKFLVAGTGNRNRREQRKQRGVLGILCCLSCLLLFSFR